MDVNKNHRRPHVHVDYGKEYHTAAYAIDTGERLASSGRPIRSGSVRLDSRVPTKADGIMAGDARGRAT
jgi:hypothetical protein